MIDTLQELVIKNGKKTVPLISCNEGKQSYTMKERIFTYGPTINKETMVKEQWYDGKVYCVEVPNNIIMVRRNGKAMWCGNCLQRIWVEILVPKSEWYKYPGCIPVDVHIEYRSWDLDRAMPSNLYGLTHMLYRYVFGNLTPDTEYIRVKDGKPVKQENLMNDGENIRDKETGVVCKIDDTYKRDFKIMRIACHGDNGHVYNDCYKHINQIMKA
jgi:hypothetical protein